MKISGIPEKRDSGPYEDPDTYEDPGPYEDLKFLTAVCSNVLSGHT